MSIKEIGNQQNDSFEVREDCAGDKTRYEGKKRIQKRMLILEGILGFVAGLFTRRLPVEVLLVLLLCCVLCLILLPLILLSD